MAGSNADFIHVYYNNAAASDGQNAAGVWSADYAGVWHMNEANRLDGHRFDIELE